MKYKSKYWHENRSYGRSASFSCKATNQADLLNEILWKLTCSYDLADQDTEMTVLQMAEARAW
jgi:hypothetical protein